MQQAIRNDPGVVLPPEEKEYEYKVSVVVAAYNVERYIADCMESLCAQTVEDIEVLCVNDGSTDSTAEIIRRYAMRDKRIKLIDKEKNEGLYMARKSGAQLARGKYILFVDADDTLVPDACEEAFKLIVREGVDYLQFGCGVINHSDSEAVGRWQESALNPPPVTLSGDKLLDCFYVDRSCGTSLVGKIFAAELCRAVYGQLDDFHCFVGEDIFQSFYYAYFARSFAAVKSKPLYIYEYGRGVGNRQMMALGKFELYCRMSELCQRVRAFLERENAMDACKAAYEAMARRMAEDCCRIYRNRIDAADKPGAAELLVKHWYDIPGCRKLIRKSVDAASLRKLCPAMPEAWVPDKLYGLLCCLRENGLRYTVFRFFEKLGLK